MSEKKGVESSIEEAMKRGDFDNLPGKGKPLRLDDYFDTPEELRVGYSVIKNAGFMPEEAELLKEIGLLKEQLASIFDEEARKRLLRQINDRQLKYDLLVERFRLRR
ncbi:MAG: DUF1992 domain-containing protein [Anaerolineales bacterium]